MGEEGVRGYIKRGGSVRTAGSGVAGHGRPRSIPGGGCGCVSWLDSAGCAAIGRLRVGCGAKQATIQSGKRCTVSSPWRAYFARFRLELCLDNTKRRWSDSGVRL